MREAAAEQMEGIAKGESWFEYSWKKRLSKRDLRRLTKQAASLDRIVKAAGNSS